MTKSKTLIEKQTKKKTNPELVETIIKAKKHKNWFKVAEALSTPKRKRISLNLDKINDCQSKKIVIPGKVLSQGEINKKIEVIAFNFSEKAKEKLLNAGCTISNIIEEIKKNPEAKGVEILK